MDPDVVRHYEGKDEIVRLTAGAGLLEFHRTKEVLQRHLPSPPADIVDVGGGTGPYSFWLAEKSYRVHLVDIVPLHVEQARRQDSRSLLASVRLGDARDLSFDSETMDAVLLLGPLYHLQERSDRIKALQEAYRILKDGGSVFCAAISRFASLLDGLRRGFLSDPTFAKIVQKNLKDGKHLNLTDAPHYFTTAYFHRPNELQEEIEEAGFTHQSTVALEGPGWLLEDLDERLADLGRREELLQALRSIEGEDTLLGVSSHLLSIGQKN